MINIFYGFVYITTNKINGKKYIGQRTYKKAGWEKYLGSGKLLRKAISRYGVENFEKEIEAWKPYVLRDAKSEWMEQKDKFQQILIANKVKPLTMSDYYVVLAGTYKLS